MEVTRKRETFSSLNLIRRKLAAHAFDSPTEALRLTGCWQRRGTTLDCQTEKAVVIDLRQFEFIKQKHGAYASWAVWADAAENPKSNTGDMSVFDLDSNPRLLEALKTNIVMVGLNISSFARLLSEPFRNFHDPSPRANDFKIRYAFRETEYCGAYMTDIIKRVGMINSKDLLTHLRIHPALLGRNIEIFREELRDLNCTAPTILAFGAAAYNILYDNLGSAEYSQLIKLTHYSHYINKEKYREMVLSQIDHALLE